MLLKTNNRNNWLAYAIGNQLSGDYAKAISVLDSFLATQDEEPKAAKAAKKEGKEGKEGKDAALADGAKAAESSEERRAEAARALEAFEGRSRAGLSFEDSELRLYRLSLLTESAQWQTALDYLDSAALRVVDSLFVLEQRAALLQRLDRSEEAEVFYRRLLQLNPEQLAYHKGLHTALGLSLDRADDAPRPPVPVPGAAGAAPQGRPRPPSAVGLHARRDVRVPPVPLHAVLHPSRHPLPLRRPPPAVRGRGEGGADRAPHAVLPCKPQGPPQLRSAGGGEERGRGRSRAEGGEPGLPSVEPPLRCPALRPRGSVAALSPPASGPTL